MSQPPERGRYGSVKGHTICFASEGAIICGQVMPELAYSNSSITISVQGPSGALRSAKLEGALRGLGALQARAEDINDWLLCFKYLNPQYQSIEVLDVTTTEKIIEELRESLISNRVELDVNSA